MDWQLTYRTTDVLRWGSGNGGSLSWAQQDENQANLETRVWTLENDPPTAIGISNITQSGNTITVWLSNGSSFGPFSLPLPNLYFREDGWLPGAGYFAGNLFVFERTGFYLVLQDHTSGDEFDPNATTTDGQLYRLLFDPFSGSVPKAIPESTDLTFIPELTDANKYLVWTNTDQLAVIIPAEDDVAFALGAELHFRQAAAGSIIIEGDTGVTINPSRPGFDTATPWQGANCTVKKVAEDEWDFIGPGTETTA